MAGAFDNPLMLDTDLPELGRVHIASPCNEKWSLMEGDAQTRHCAACKFTVYNFSELTSEDARLLLRRNAGGERICARIYKRLDGTVMTKDCPKGYRYGLRVARRLLPHARGIAVALVILIAIFVGGVTVFGDNLRQLFATSAGGLEYLPVATVPVKKVAGGAITGKVITNFGEGNPY